VFLSLQRSHVELLKQEAQRVFPVEACAILFGRLSENEAVVEKVEIAQNRLRSSTRFEVDPSKVARSIVEAEKEGLEFVGLFHSHPAPAVPSEIDRKFMRLWDDTVWLILSSTENRLDAFQLVDEKMRQVAIRIK
jgi:[CysO sulfur-carrier protein]-S-L-cysteine hydrolase